jgi:hypothetical protein
MKKTIIFALVFAVVGLIVGYILFGKIAGEYASLKAIFGANGNAFESFGRKMSGLAQIKQNILASGGIGLVLGLIIRFVKKK